MVIDKTKSKFKRKDFIREHLIKSINRLAISVNSTLKSHSFVFFDVPLPTTVQTSPKIHKLAYVNRVGRERPYLRDEIVPMEWTELSNKKLLLLFRKLQTNKVYVYKHIEGVDKPMKVRVKNG